MTALPHEENDESSVLAANTAFYEALESLTLAQMDSLWLHEEWVKCLHPGWDLLVGWEEIRRSWKQIFQSTVRMLVAVTRASAYVSGDTAWVSCLANITYAGRENFSTALVEATNIFVRRQGQWLMVHHHTTALPHQGPTGESTTVQ